MGLTWLRALLGLDRDAILVKFRTAEKIVKNLPVHIGYRL
jgi:hypothetical protein